MTARSVRATGVGLALASATGFGVMPVLARLAYDDGAEPLGLLAVRFTSAAVILLGLARWRGEALPRGRTLVALALLGGVGYVCEALFYFAALERIGASLTALLLYAYPAVVVLLSAVVLRRRPGGVALACVAVASAGTALTVGPVGSASTTGVLLGLAAAATYAVYIVTSSVVLDRPEARATGLFATSAVVMAAAGVVCSVLATAQRADLPRSADGWWAVAGVSLFGTVLGVAAFFAALTRLGPSDTAVLSTAEPVVSVGAAYLVLGETLTGLQLLGGLAVVAAVVVLARRPALSATAPPAEPV